MWVWLNMGWSELNTRKYGMPKFDPNFAIRTWSNPNKYCSDISMDNMGRDESDVNRTRPDPTHLDTYSVNWLRSVEAVSGCWAINKNVTYCAQQWQCCSKFPFSLTAMPKRQWCCYKSVVNWQVTQDIKRPQLKREAPLVVQLGSNQRSHMYCPVLLLPYKQY